MYPEKRWQDLSRAFLMLLSDRPDRQLDAVYLHGLSDGMISTFNLFDHLADIWEQDRTIAISFNGSDGRGAGEKNDYPGAGWPGAEWYREELMSRRIYSSSLYPTRNGLHTRDEVDAFIELCKENGWRSVGIATVPYHYPRVFICLIKAMEKLSYYPAVYALSPRTTMPNWWTPMKGSQGSNDTIAFDECFADFERVFKYQDKGFGSQFDELFEYLQCR